MIRLLIAGIFNFYLAGLLIGQYTPDPGWGTRIKLDEAEAIVVAKMDVEDEVKGHGTLNVSSVLKGKQSLRKVKVQFSVRSKNRRGYQAPPFEVNYWYSDGQEAIWLLMDKGRKTRYQLEQPKLCYYKKWVLWIQEQLVILKNREWTRSNGLAGSVIVDSLFMYKYKRSFYLCLRNDSKKTIHINKHYNLVQDHNSKACKFTTARYEASIASPNGEIFDMIKCNDDNECQICLRVSRVRVEPAKKDFVKLKPGEVTYLFQNGAMKCFIRNPSLGTYLFSTSYKNDYKMGDFDGQIWTGKITFPVTKFAYDINK